MRRTWTCIAFLLLVAASLNAQNYYYYRGVDSTYSVRLVGVSTDVNTTGITLDLTWDTDLGVWKTPVTRTGLYYRYEDPNGGTTFSLDSKGTLVRIGSDISGAAYLGRIADADDDGKIDLSTAEDSTLTLQQMTTNAIAYLTQFDSTNRVGDDVTIKLTGSQFYVDTSGAWLLPTNAKRVAGVSGAANFVDERGIYNIIKNQPWVNVKDVADSLGLTSDSNWTAAIDRAEVLSRVLYFPAGEIRVKNWQPGKVHKYIGAATTQNAIDPTVQTTFVPVATGDTMVNVQTTQTDLEFENITFRGRSSTNDTASVGFYFRTGDGHLNWKGCTFYDFERSGSSDTAKVLVFADEQQLMLLEDCYFRDNDVHVYMKETNSFTAIRTRFLNHHKYGVYIWDHEGATFINCHFENAQNDAEHDSTAHGLVLRQARGVSLLGGYVELPDTNAVRWINFINDPTGGDPTKNYSSVFIAGGRVSGDLNNDYVISADASYTQRLYLDIYDVEFRADVKPVEARDTLAFHVNLTNVGFTTASVPGVERLTIQNYNSDDYTYASGALSISRMWDRWALPSDSLAGYRNLRTEGFNVGGTGEFGINTHGQIFSGLDASGKVNVSTTDTDTFDVAVVFSVPHTLGHGFAEGEYLVSFGHPTASNQFGQVFRVHDYQRGDGSNANHYSTVIDTLINNVSGNDKIASIAVTGRTNSGYTLRVVIDASFAGTTTYYLGGQTTYGGNIRSAAATLY